jgi:hypothetical protein
MIAGDKLIADAERLGDEEQDAGETILEDVPERKPDRDAADAKGPHTVGMLHRSRSNRSGEHLRCA